MNNYMPSVIVFRCSFCSPAGSTEALASQLNNGFQPRIIQTNCTGRIDPTYVLDAFARGADGVMIAGCAPGDCHYVTGNYKANRNYLLLKKTLAQLGIEPERLTARWLADNDPDQAAGAVREFAGRLAKLGPVRPERVIMEV